MAATSSISGVISGLKTDDIIAKMMEIQKQPITDLQTKKADLTSKMTAWQDANARVLAFKTAASALADSKSFDVTKFSSSDSTLVTGSASSTASPGTFVLKVTSLARAHQIKSGGYADDNKTSVGTGSITVTLGDGTQSVIKIDSSDDTLQGVAKAINKAGAGVTASVINDGSATNPYRLVINSQKTGTAGHIDVTNNLSGGTAPVFTTMQAAKDAVVSLGDGADAVTVTKSTNTIDDLIPGVTLNLVNEDTTKAISITVGSDTTTIKNNIQNFVTQYNNMVDYFGQQFSYDSSTNATGTLFTDASMQNIQTDLALFVSNPVTGIRPTYDSSGQPNTVPRLLNDIGVTMDTSNHLVYNDSDVDSALRASLTNVKRVFSTCGDPSNDSVQYISSSDKTKASQAAGYAVNITQVATKPTLTAAVAQTDVLAHDEILLVNDIQIMLKAGMDQTQVIAKINDSKDKTGVEASATGSDGTGSGNYLTLTDLQYGSDAVVRAVSTLANSGADQTAGIGNAEIKVAGLDVAGTINGEAATGRGQLLTGDSSNTNTADLQLLITGKSAGDYGVVNFSRGVGATISNYLDFLVKPDTGTISTSEASLQTQMDDIDKEISDLTDASTGQEDALREKYAAMESALGQLQDQSSYLTQQINAWNGVKK